MSGLNGRDQSPSPSPPPLRAKVKLFLRLRNNSQDSFLCWVVGAFTARPREGFLLPVAKADITWTERRHTPCSPPCTKRTWPLRSVVQGVLCTQDQARTPLPQRHPIWEEKHPGRAMLHRAGRAKLGSEKREERLQVL